MLRFNKIRILDIVNFITIVCSISFKVTIVPYMIFSSFQFSDLFPLVLVLLELFTIAYNKEKGLLIKTDFLRFRPLAMYFSIMFIQFLIALVYFRINSIGASVLYFADSYLICVLVYSLCIDRTKGGETSGLSPWEYNIFAYINVLLVCIAALLMLTHIIPSMSNDVSEMCVLFKGNVETGQRYYMPLYISLQNDTTRLTSLGELTGWAFEPHLFCLLVFPAFFFLLGRTSSRLYKSTTIVLFLFSAFWGFSVTGLITMMIVGTIALINESSKSVLKFVILLVCISLSLFYFWDTIMDSLIFEYTRTKLVDNTTSADYSKGNLEWCLSPTTVVGQGIMRWDLEHNNNPDIGVISYIVIIMFFISTLFYIYKVISSNTKQIRFIGYGVLYVFLHSMKMANAIFYMPIVSMSLVILYIAYQKQVKSK